jgi:polyhydroxybutyrate depolymerase
MRRAVLFFFVPVLCACMDFAPPADGGADVPVRDAGPPDPRFGTAERPATVALPAAHDGTTELPLVVLLHGYGLGAAFQNAYFGLDDITRARGVYLLLPESPDDSFDSPYWNATDACCDFDRSGVDDVAALEALLDEVIAALPIDESRIYFLGHSNGGFMSYRFACERGSRLAAIGVLAGDDFLDPTACVPTTPVSVLHMHGDADEIIPYAGGTAPTPTGATALEPFPSARTSIDRWAAYAGCDATPVDGTDLDLSPERAGHEEVLETDVLDWNGCDAGLGASFWTLRGEGHIPAFRPDAFGHVLDWFLEHSR